MSNVQRRRRSWKSSLRGSTDPDEYDLGIDFGDEEFPRTPDGRVRLYTDTVLTPMEEVGIRRRSENGQSIVLKGSKKKKKKQRRVQRVRSKTPTRASRGGGIDEKRDDLSSTRDEKIGEQESPGSAGMPLYRRITKRIRDNRRRSSASTPHPITPFGADRTRHLYDDGLLPIDETDEVGTSLELEESCSLLTPTEFPGAADEGRRNLTSVSSRRARATSFGTRTLRISYDGGIETLSEESGPDVPIPPSTSGLSGMFRRTFLPVGYPHTVEDHYMAYQIFDVVQGLCSYLRGQLAIQKMLEGFGVGDVEATASAGAIGWIMRDGASMLGSLVFSALAATDFGMRMRQWRLFADVINDVGLTLNMIAPMFGKDYFLPLVCAGSVCTAMCGVAAGATKAKISQHFARNNNLADLVAKEGAQESIVTLLGIAGGYVFLRSLEAYEQYAAEAEEANFFVLWPFWFATKSIVSVNEVMWMAFVALTVLHVIANVYAIGCLKLRTVNSVRFGILFDRFVTDKSEKEDVYLGEDPDKRRQSRRRARLAKSSILSGRKKRRNGLTRRGSAGSTTLSSKEWMRNANADMSIESVARDEPLLPWDAIWPLRVFCGIGHRPIRREIRMGVSVNSLRGISPSHLALQLRASKRKSGYVLIRERPGGIAVILHVSATTETIIQARCHAELLLRSEHHTFEELKGESNDQDDAIRHRRNAINASIASKLFVQELRTNGWDLQTREISVGAWRYSW
eukprot:g5032.t1